MEIIVFEKKAYYKMLEEVKTTILEAIEEHKAATTNQLQIKEGEEWIPAQQAQKILKCKKDKLKSIRDKGEITVSKSGRNVLYYTSSLYEYLNKNIKH
jgi:hypothetical protein